MSAVVDMHSHLYPPRYLDLLRLRTRFPRVATIDGEDRFIIFPEEDDPVTPKGRPIGEDFWSVEAKLRYMDATGIARSVVSLGNPWLDPFGGQESVAHAATLNEEFASLEQRTLSRVVGLGVLPNDTVDAAVAGVDQIAADPRLRGLVSGPRICGCSFDDEALEPVWESLARTGTPVLVHPSDGVALDALGGFGHTLPIALGFPFETTVALTRLVLAGVLQRHPGLTVVAAHGGGTLPFLAGRLDAAWRSDPEARRRLQVPPSTQVALLHTDALVYHPRAVRAVVDLVGPRVMFGTDHPFSVADPDANLTAIRTALDERAQDSVLSGHAISLFRLNPA